MTAVLLVAADVPFMQQLFPPVPLIEQVHRTPMLIFGVLYFCLAVAYLALWRAASDFRVFRSMGILFAVLGAQQFFEYFGGIGAPVWSLRALAVAILVETAAEAMRIQNRRWTRFFWPVYLFAFFTGWFPSLAFVNDWPVVCSQAALAILIIQGFRHGNRRDRAIAAVFTAYFPMRMTISTSFTRITGIENYAMIGGWRWQYTTCSLTLLGAATLAIFVRDLINDRREKQRMAAELEAGRAVQQVLIPEEVPIIPGFNIQSVNKPYGEVGGDFFQVLPVHRDGTAGGVLAIIGDVSGKGMPAAMTVSLLVGTVRTLAHYTQSPGEILAAMNQRMIGRSHGGFTTCLVLRADPDGTLTIANAGHIAPYLAGKELKLENGLPLGLAAETAYSESRLNRSARISTRRCGSSTKARPG